MADLFVGREQPDQERRDAHDDEREHEHRLAADLVAVVPDDDAADRPGEEAHGIGAEGRERAHQRVEGGEEQPVEDERGRRAVEEEVVPLDCGTNETRDGDEPDGVVSEARVVTVIERARYARESAEVRRSKLLSGADFELRPLPLFTFYCGGLYDSQSMHTELQEAIDLHEAIVAEAGNALVGYETEKALANVVLLSEIPTTYDKDQKRQVNAGNLLLRGVPGVGKTFFGVILAAISNAKFARIQGRADLQPTEIVGFQMINPATGEFITEFGPLASAEIILLDEINRIPLKSQSAFLEGLQDRTVTVGKTTYEMAPFSFAIATMNPVELGTGHVSALGGGDRSVRDHDQHRVPAAARRREARQLRLQAGQAQGARAEGAHHRAAVGDHARGIPARCAGQVHPSPRGRDASLQR